jgi:alkanesulfonate monooxygenase SsuD/methylene tetrahydromethanopterin reductase-like flavin-dependent oxidoreductase (luciferase family)
MRFSVLFAAPVLAGSADDERAVLRSCVEQAVCAETYGFYRVWVMEHHGLTGYGHISAPDVLLAWIAARTSTLRLGMGVAMPPAINHPVRVAERAALLDVLSGGRVDIAAAGGRSGCEAALFGNDVSKVEEERDLALARIARLWSDASTDQPAVLPRPVQIPHPPLFATCGDGSSARRAGALGLGALAFGFAGVESAPELVRSYRAGTSSRSESIVVAQPDQFSMLCPTVVLRDRGRAEAIGHRAERYFRQAANHWYAGGPEPTGDEDGALAITGAYGTSETANEFADALQAAGVDEVVCFVQMGTVSSDVCLETLERWGADVLPRFADCAHDAQFSGHNVPENPTTC